MTDSLSTAPKAVNGQNAAKHPFLAYLEYVKQLKHVEHWDWEQRVKRFGIGYYAPLRLHPKMC